MKGTKPADRLRVVRTTKKLGSCEKEFKRTTEGMRRYGKTHEPGAFLNSVKPTQAFLVLNFGRAARVASRAKCKHTISTQADPAARVQALFSGFVRVNEEEGGKADETRIPRVNDTKVNLVVRLVGRSGKFGGFGGGRRGGRREHGVTGRETRREGQKGKRMLLAARSGHTDSKWPVAGS